MRKIFTLLFLSILNLAFSQTEDSINMNGGYAMDVFYSLENSTIQTVANAEWTVALSTGAQSSSIYTNDGQGVDLYETNFNIEDFATVDTPGLSTWTKRYNNYSDWEKSAFEYSATGHPNYGWGAYNDVSHIVTGNKVFIIKTLADTYYKTMIVKKESGAWSFRYATLNNSFDTTIVYQATDLFDRNFAYLNMDNHLISNREPANTEWELLFTKYHDIDIDYNVTGVLVNKGIEIVEIVGVTPTDATYDGETFSDATNIIGSDWKVFDMSIPPFGAYVLDDDRTFFIKKINGDIYKLNFTRFDGSSTGKIGFNKEKVADGSTAVSEISNVGSISVYPNPAKNIAHLVLDIKTKTDLNYTIFNLLGKTIENKNLSVTSGLNVINIDVQNFNSGIYLVQVQNGKETQTLKLNVSK